MLDFVKLYFDSVVITRTLSTHPEVSRLKLIRSNNFSIKVSYARRRVPSLELRVR